MRGIYIRITSAMRTSKEQNELWKQGRMKPGRIVTDVDDSNSYHTHGLAIDIAVLWRIGPIQFKALWARKYYEEIGYIARELGLEQPYANDLPHIQYSGGLSIKNLKDGKRPKKPTFAPWLKTIPVQRVIARLTNRGILPLV